MSSLHPDTCAKSWSRLASYAWVPLPILSVTICWLCIAGLPGSFESPLLLVALNFIFSTLASFLVVHIVTRSFLLSRQISLLALGCGVLILGLAGIVGSLVGKRDPNILVSIHNSCVFLAAICHLTGFALSSRSLRRSSKPLLTVSAAYLAATLAVISIALLAYYGRLPVFFVNGQGGTVVRQIVLSSAIIMFALAAILARYLNTTPRSAFRHWYSLALGLIAIGLTGILEQSATGSALSWVGRISQYLGGIYIFIAGIASVRENGLFGLSLEAAFHETRGRYDTLVEMNPDAIFVHSAGKYVYANPAAVRLLGAASPEQIIGRNVLDLVDPADHPAIIARIESVYAGIASPVRETRFRRLDGSFVDIDVTGAPVEFAGKPAAQIVVRDITDRKSAELALQDGQERLRLLADQLDIHVKERTAELVLAVGDLQAEIERRKTAENVLTAQAAQLRALATELTRAEQRERRRLALVLHDDLQQLLAAAKLRVVGLRREKDARISQQAREVDELIAQAITSSRTLTGELSPPILHEGDLAGALEWLARWMKDKHALTVKLDICNEGARVQADTAAIMFSAARELLFNIVKHANVSTACLELARTNGNIRISVSDKGAGFDIATLELPRQDGGSFGLFSIRERLSIMGGSLSIDSAPGKGCRVDIVSPPLLEEAPARPGARRLSMWSDLAAGMPTAVPSSTGKKIRVLIADDHLIMRQGLRRLLSEESDIEIVGEAGDGATAIGMARGLLPDVILMDINMPGVNGVQATATIHAELPETIIIGLSMFEEPEKAAEMRQAGAAFYLAKSEASESLVAAVRSAYQTARLSK
jgi:PAS domain S-box-containing protein